MLSFLAFPFSTRHIRGKIWRPCLWYYNGPRALLAESCFMPVLPVYNSYSTFKPFSNSSEQPTLNYEENWMQLQRLTGFTTSTFSAHLWKLCFNSHSLDRMLWRRKEKKMMSFMDKWRWHRLCSSASVFFHQWNKRRAHGIGGGKEKYKSTYFSSYDTCYKHCDYSVFR